MTRADREAIAEYLRETAEEMHRTYYWPRAQRVAEKRIRDEIAQLRKWAKMLMEDKPRADQA